MNIKTISFYYYLVIKINFKCIFCIMITHFQALLTVEFFTKKCNGGHYVVENEFFAGDEGAM